MYQPRIVRGASRKYSGHVDALVVWSSATVLAMNDRLLPPATIVPPPDRKGSLPSGRFLPVIDRSAPDDTLRKGVAVAPALLRRRRLCFKRLQ